MKNYFVGAVAALAFAATAGAQDSTKTVTEPSQPAAGGVTVSVAGGMAFPVGKSNDALKPGWTALGGVGFNLPWVPFALRAEGAYNRFNVDKTSTITDGKVQAITGSLNGIVQAPLMMGAAPYLTAGLGVGHVKSEATVKTGTTTVSGDETENKLMWNAGVGLKWSMPRFDVFAEGRYTQIMTDTKANGYHLSYIPVFVGLTFRP